MLIPSTQWTTEIRDMANAILRKALGEGKHDGTDKYQLGLTKIFFRAGMLAFLENLRTNRLNAAAVMIQKNLRAQVPSPKKYLEVHRVSYLAFQALMRGLLARRKGRKRVGGRRGATSIQRVWRGQKAREGLPTPAQRSHLLEAAAQGLALPQR